EVFLGRERRHVEDVRRIAARERDVAHRGDEVRWHRRPCAEHHAVPDRPRRLLDSDLARSGQRNGDRRADYGERGECEEGSTGDTTLAHDVSPRSRTEIMA